MCEFTVPASGAALAPVRHRVQRWLADLDWPVDAAADIVFAVNEAVTNAVEHAYPAGPADAPVEISASVETHVSGGGRASTRQVRVSVRDHGRWRDDVHNRSDISRTRGRGLAMMDAMTAELVVATSATTGTTVMLVSEPVAGR